MSPMVSLIHWVVIVPLTVVDGNLHLRHVSMIQTVAAAVVVIPVEILRVIDVGIVVKPRVVPAARSVAPTAAISLLLIGLLSVRNGCGRHASHERDGCD